MNTPEARRRLASHVLTPTGAMRAWPAVLLTAVGMGLAMILMFGYVRKVDQQNDQRDIRRQREICGLLRAVAGPDASPPADARAAAIAAELHRYAHAIGCPS